MSEPGWRVEVFGPNAAWEELVGHGCTTFAMASEYVAKFASGACYMPPLRLVSEGVYAPSPISLNQPSPLVKAEALALLDSAFEAEFDLLPEDAKPLCDTFYRSLRKRLGHPVECSGKSPDAADEMEKLRERLRDPAAVHVALIRGEIARPSIRDMLHAYGVLAEHDADTRDAARWRWVTSHAAEESMPPIAVCKQYRDTPQGHVFAAAYGETAEALVDKAMARADPRQRV